MATAKMKSAIVVFFLLSLQKWSNNGTYMACAGTAVSDEVCITSMHVADTEKINISAEEIMYICVSCDDGTVCHVMMVLCVM